MRDFDPIEVREDFPILHQMIHGHPLIYLDTAASAQKPKIVIDRMNDFYQNDYANVHRAVHTLSERATQAFEQTREKVKDFIGAQQAREIIFTRGTTEAINLLAYTLGVHTIEADDEILISHMEHHSNIVPWKMLCERTGAQLKIVPINDQGELCLESYRKLLNHRTKLVSIVHMSNSLGTINPVKLLIELAHAQGIPVLLDGAQAAAHFAIDVQDLDCDFYAFSSHKVFGPTGVGVLYGKLKYLEQLPPYQGGGDMISAVNFEKITYREVPYRFEAGTPSIVEVIGLGAAIDYLNQFNRQSLINYEHALLEYATQRLSEIPQLRLIGTAADKAGVISFILEQIHPHDIATILDDQGIAIRAGHHCTMPLMQRFQLPATARISLAFYNTFAEIDKLVKALYQVLDIFK